MLFKDSISKNALKKQTKKQLCHPINIERVLTIRDSNLVVSSRVTGGPRFLSRPTQNGEAQSLSIFLIRRQNSEYKKVHAFNFELD